MYNIIVNEIKTLRKADSAMSAKLNRLFFNAYIEVDKLCAAKLGLESGGLNEYINKLINSRFAPDREETLNRLTRYRGIRNAMAHRSGALDQLDEIDKTDIKWLQSFSYDLSHKRDPLSRYLRRARGYVRRRRFFGVIIAAVVILAAVLGYIHFFM